ncbi:MAG: hypothetical protein DLM69_09330 [Candidatus Chloroheliales bacterium]|nr:MAG: hypothetical protein DLM69_09330 [Chloroflexota bacterium]
MPLSCANVNAIVRVLAKWGVLQSKVAAIELLALANCPPFKPEEWQQPPLNQLAPSPQYAALSTQHSAPGNLPLPLTSFVGREVEMRELAALLTSTRLLTISGAGGMGKTRLANELATTLLGQYDDGCWMVDLTRLHDRTMLLCAIALILGIRDEPGRMIEETLVDCIRPRRLLLLLDNCEHMLAFIAAPVKLLLENCPHLQILATSREPLGVSGEVEWRLSPLALPSANLSLSSAQAQSHAAVSLFVARAQAVLPRFRLTERNTASVVQICQQLDGIPLAIELAAPLVKALSVEQIARRLEHRFRLLRSSDSAAPTRQQTLRASLQWSYDLLNEPERTLLRRLAVFGGGWSLEAAEVICAGDFSSYSLQSEDVLNLLIQLVNKSLVQANEQDGAARYTMLETIRQFAAELLVAHGEEQPLRQRHASLYLALAEQATRELSGPQQQDWLDHLELELGNIRTALGWYLRAGMAEYALRMVVAMWWFWLVSDHHPEGRLWMEAVLRMPSEALALRAKALIGLGNLHVVDYNYEAAKRCQEQALAILQQLGDEQGIALALNNLGMVATDQGDYQAAIRYLTQSLTLYQQMVNRPGIAETLTGYATLAAAVGPAETAATLFGAAEALRQAHNLTIPPEGRAHYERYLATTRSQMDEASFNAAWSIGCTLTEEQVIALVRSLPIPDGAAISH